MKTFEVSEKCVCCGMCTQKTNLLVENTEGKAIPTKRCVITTAFLKKAEQIAKDCPVGAIRIIEKGEIKKENNIDINRLVNFLKTKLEKVEKPVLKKDDVKLDVDKYHISTPYMKFSSGYDYSSESSAIDAALDEFNRCYYSQYKRFITEILVQYREDKLKKYYTFDRNSFWGQANAKYEKVLLDFANEVEGTFDGKIKFPADFMKFEAYPGGIPDVEKSYKMYVLKHFDEYNIIPRIMEEFNDSEWHRKNAYKMYIDTDDMEIYVGESFFGNAKYKTRYSYSAYRIGEEYIKDLKGAIGYADVADRPFDEVKSAIESYNEEVKNVIEEKMKQLKSIIKNPSLLSEMSENNTYKKSVKDDSISAEQYVLKRFVPDKIVKSSNI